MFKDKTLGQHITEMRNLGEVLVPYNYPLAPAEWESDINILKMREITVDGYTVVAHYSKADYETHYLETLQLLGKNCPFLPFCLVCKLGSKFLGQDGLSLIEFFRDNRKVYCWTLTVDRDGQPIPNPYEPETEHCTYEGFSYHYMHPSQVNFH